ncbi:MAG: hypothetical protein ACO3NL_02230 [Phycisphaerales bacterium]
MADSDRTGSRASAAFLAWLLALWLSCGVAVVVAAIAAFPSLAGKGVIVPGYEILVESGDSAASGRLAAGFVMDRVFAMTDLAQWILAPLAFLAAAWCWRRLRGCPGRRLAGFVMALAAAALGLVLGHNLAIGPSMLVRLEEYRSLLLAGDLENALAVRDGFDAMHVLADRLYGLRMLLVALALPLALLLPAAPAGGRA